MTTRQRWTKLLPLRQPLILIKMPVRPKVSKLTILKTKQVFLRALDLQVEDLVNTKCKAPSHQLVRVYKEVAACLAPHWGRTLRNRVPAKQIQVQALAHSVVTASMLLLKTRRMWKNKRRLLLVARLEISNFSSNNLNQLPHFHRAFPWTLEQGNKHKHQRAHLVDTQCKSKMKQELSWSLLKIFNRVPNYFQSREVRVYLNIQTWRFHLCNYSACA